MSVVISCVFLCRKSFTRAYKMTETAEFEWYDYLLFVGVLVISGTIGLAFACLGGRQRTTKEYLTADRQLTVLPVTLSMYMSFTSGIMVLGNAAEMYTYGVQLWFVTVGTAVAYVLGALLFLPLFYKLKLTSSFEYFELRYNSVAVRKFGSVLSIISGILYSGLALYTPSTSLEAVTPIPMWATVVALGVVSTIYTTFGGIKAVVWTDAFQGVAMLVGVIAICVLGIQQVGGMDALWNINLQNHRLWVTFDPNPMIRVSMWSVIVGSVISGMSTTGTSQMSIQRYSGMKSIKHAFTSALLCIPLHMIFYTLTFMAGAAMFAHYHLEGCCPLRSEQVSNTNQLLSYFVLDGIGKPALPGLIVAILCVGALSSISSSINSNAAVTWKDFLEGRGPFKKMSENGRTWVNKLLSFIYGGISIAMAFAYRDLPGHGLQVSRSISRSAGSPILGMFILAAFFPFTTPIGVMVGAGVGFAAHLTVGLGNSLYNPWPLTLNTSVSQCSVNYTINDDMLVGNPDVPIFFQMSFQWHETWGTAVTVFVGIIVSLISGARTPSEQDPRYIVPFFDRVFGYLPLSCRKKLWCGVKHTDASFFSETLGDGDSLMTSSIGSDDDITAKGTYSKKIPNDVIFAPKSHTAYDNMIGGVTEDEGLYKRHLSGTKQSVYIIDSVDNIKGGIVVKNYHNNGRDITNIVDSSRL